MFNYMPGIGSTGPYIPTYPPLQYTGVLPQYQHMVGVGNQYLSPADQARVSSPYWTGGGMGGGGGSSAPPSGGGSSGGGQQGTWPGPTIGTPQTRDQRLAEIRARLGARPTGDIQSSSAGIQPTIQNQLMSVGPVPQPVRASVSNVRQNPIPQQTYQKPQQNLGMSPITAPFVQPSYGGGGIRNQYGPAIRMPTFGMPSNPYTARMF